MRKYIGLTFLLPLAFAAVSLASKPKPMDCDTYKCGDHCAPAKYARVRHAWAPPWLLTTPLYGAAIIESSALAGLLIVSRLAARARRAGSDPAPTAEDLAKGTTR